MATFVITVSGEDRPRIITDLSGVLTTHGGNWERSQLARLAGRFIGLVEASVADERYDAVAAALSALETSALQVWVERVDPVDDEEADETNAFVLELLGHDRPGIVAEVSAVLAAHDVRIQELVTEVRDAPMAGGTLFEARAVLVAPPAGTDALRVALEGLANELMVDLTVTG